MKSKYLFTSERLGFRTWKKEDIKALHTLNSDPKVMRYFPRTLTREETDKFVKRMQALFKDKGHCYFPVELLTTGAFIGFIGLSLQDFEAAFTPVKDIGWRLAPEFWGKGYATEGAKRCLLFAGENLGWKEVYAIAPLINTPSVGVMKKLGMKKVKNFVHPQLEPDSELQPCVLYRTVL